MDPRNNNPNALACIILAVMLCFCQNAKANVLKETISKLEPLSLHYGTNTLQLKGHDLLIVRGKFENGNAWGGDAYTVLVKQKDESWQLVRHEKGGWESVLTNTQPHTKEDSIISVSFMVPKGEATSNTTALYLLTTHRNFQESPIDIVPTKFTLDIVQPDSDFGVYYFHKLASEISKAKYCNADSAAYHELGIPLPGDEKEFPCVKSK